MAEIPVKWPLDDEAILGSIQRLFVEGKWWFYRGESVRELEESFARLHDAAYGVAVCNGTIALEILLRALGIGPGERVVLPAYDFYSLPKSVLNVGAVPVFVDVYPENPTLDPRGVEEALALKPAAVVAVHISGSVAELDALSALCRSAGVILIEDCAQATGARYAGRHVGSWGRAGLFSFGGTKLVTCGQGGMIVTDDEELYEKCYAIVNRGRDSRFKYNKFGIIGDNYQLSELAAAVALPQLAILGDLCRRREKAMRLFDGLLQGLPGVRTLRQHARTEIRAQMRYSFYFNPVGTGFTDRAAFLEAARVAGIPLEAGFSCVVGDAGLSGRFAGEHDYPVAMQAQRSVAAIHHPFFLNDERVLRDTAQKIGELLENLIVGR